MHEVTPRLVAHAHQVGCTGWEKVPRSGCRRKDPGRAGGSRARRLDQCQESKWSLPPTSNPYSPPTPSPPCRPKQPPRPSRPLRAFSLASPRSLCPRECAGYRMRHAAEGNGRIENMDNRTTDGPADPCMLDVGVGCRTRRVVGDMWCRPPEGCTCSTVLRAVVGDL
jgi:hypothetical protein